MLCNRLVRFLGRQACKLTRFLGHLAMAVHRHNNRNFGIVIVADVIVFDAVARSRVNAAGTAFQRNVVAHNDERCAVDERVRRLHILKIAAL